MKKGRQDRIAETLTLENEICQWLVEFLIKPSNSYASDRLKRSFPFPKAML